MENQPARMMCGNDPRAQLTDGDRQAVTDFRAYLADRAALRDRIADALREADTYAQLERRDDRERFAAAVLTVVPPPVDRATVLREAADELESSALGESLVYAAARLRRMADQAELELRRMGDGAQP